MQAFAQLRVGLALLTATAGAATLHGQQPAPRDPRAAQPERPTVATHAGTVAPGWLEFESGFEFDRASGGQRITIGTLVTKFGVAPRLQVELFTSWVDGDEGRGVGDAAIGLKWRLVDQHPLLGDFALVPVIKAPTGSTTRGTGTGTVDAALWLVSSRDLGSLHLDLNLVYTRRDGGGESVLIPKQAWLWTAAAAAPITGRLAWTAEVYGVPSTSGPAGEGGFSSLLTGPVFTLRNWLVLDAGTITPLFGRQPRAFYAGVTTNVGRLR
jgi:hypothetical protein